MEDNILANEKVEQKNINKKHIYYRLPMRIGMFFTMIILTIVAMASLSSSFVCVNYNMYTQSLEKVTYEALDSYLFTDYNYIRMAFNNKDYDDIDNLVEDTNLGVDIRSGTNFYHSSNIDAENSYVYSLPYEYENGVTTDITLYINRNLDKIDRYSFYGSILETLYNLKLWLILILVASGLCALIIFVYLVCAVGHSPTGELHPPKGITKIPLEILTFIYCISVILILVPISKIVYNLDIDVISFIFVSLFGVAEIIFTSIFALDIVARIKAKTLIKNTIIYRILKLTYMAFQHITYIWKNIFIYFSISIFFLIVSVIAQSIPLVFLWILLNAIILPLVIICSVMGEQLDIAHKELAKGNLSYEIDTSKLFLGYKRKACEINSIRNCISIAVEEKTKSERMKTELITNVSHDIKTPLTSIINYTDLISKEETDNQNIREYSQILVKQSNNLKKLIDDLVQASKASTGNIDVCLTPIDLEVFLSQIIGEYEQKFTEKGISIVSNQMAESVQINADGQKLWRVFDNLLNNAYKYSMEGTRVYFAVQLKNNIVEIIIKNTSKYELNIAPSELTERFVRGDQSRHSEGSGLGLYIAKNLVELQNGTLDITIDGDLFKVTVSFDCLDG